MRRTQAMKMMHFKKLQIMLITITIFGNQHHHFLKTLIKINLILLSIYYLLFYYHIIYLLLLRHILCLYN